MTKFLDRMLASFSFYIALMSANNCLTSTDPLWARTISGLVFGMCIVNGLGTLKIYKNK